MANSSLADPPRLATQPTILKFSQRPCAWDFERQAVRFWGAAGDTAVLCRVTLKALQDHFELDGAGGPLAQEAFASGRPQIEALAIQKWNAGALEPDGSILLRSEDF